MIGNRIQRARKALGLSLRELAEQVSSNEKTLSHNAIKKYEHNEMAPSSDVLLRLAKALQVKVEYFFRPEHFTLENIQYRKHDDIPQKQLDSINALMLNCIERRIELESLFPSSPIQEFNHDNIIKSDNPEEVANQIREQWKLGCDPLPDLIDIFEENGIKVFEIDNCGYTKFDGLSASINGIPIIIIGDQWPGDRQRFTLAHELGHLLLTDESHGIPNEEEWCDKFAGAFLLPRDSLIKILGQHRNYIEPFELGLLKQEFGISMQAILHRAEEAEIITNKLYRQLRNEFDQRGWTKQEPGEKYPREKTHLYQQMVFRALAEEYISESKAAELMNISLERFRSLRAMDGSNAANHK